MRSFIIMFFTASLLHSTESRAQCDNAYFPFEEGVTFELTNFKPNGKETSKSRSEIQNAGEENTMLVKNQLFDKKGELLNEGEYSVICDDGTIKLDMKGMIPEETMRGGDFENMEMEIEGDFLEIPGELEVGQKLPDGAGTINMKISQGGMDMNTQMDLAYTDRKVEAKESVTTPAGTFEAYKVTQTTTVDTRVMGMNKSVTTSSADWIAEGVGTVKSEQYNKKGKVQGYTLLTDLGKK